MFVKTFGWNEREERDPHVSIYKRYPYSEFRKRVHSFKGIEIISKTMNWVNVVIKRVKRYVVLILIIPKQ